MKVQLPLFTRTPEVIVDYLSAASGRKIELDITNNRSSFLSVRWQKERAMVRMSKIFLSAADEVIAEIARLITKGSRMPMPLVRSFVRGNTQNLPRPNVGHSSNNSSDNNHTKGKFFDLGEIFTSLNETYFGGMLTADIAWGRKSRRVSKLKKTLGSYNGINRKITISPCLDKKHIPLNLLEFVIYHEMLHADIGVQLKNGRRVLHPPVLRERERLYKNYRMAHLYLQKQGNIT